MHNNTLAQSVLKSSYIVAADYIMEDYTLNSLFYRCYQYIGQHGQKQRLVREIGQVHVPFSSIVSFLSFDKNGEGGIKLKSGEELWIDKKPYREALRFHGII